MKKSLLALAALSAIAGVAQAQSSVTVYGILDVGYIGGNTSVQNSAGTAGYNKGVAKSTVSQFGQSAEQTSRLGFKGVEDLGNGNSAFFTAEFYLYPADQTLSGNTTNGLNSRQAFVGLKKNGVGQAAVGLQYTPVFNAAAATDPGQFNNLTGNVIYAGSTGITSGNAGTNNLGFTNRTANTLSLQSDKFAGFSASAIYTLNNKNQTETGVGTTATTGGNTNASGWGLGLDYTYNKFYIAAAYQALKQLTSSNDITAIWANQQASGATAAPVAATAGSISGTASNVQDNQFYAGATYDFGILKAYAQYVSRKATNTLNTNYYGKRAAEQIGVRSYITPTIEAWASAGLGRYTTFGTTQPTANFSGWQLGSNYYLSKRTNVYAIYGSTVTSTAATANGATVGGSQNNYAIGVRHTF
jgi:predicted porin